MNKYKVVVYAISKNESAFVDRWYESMKEADEIYVLDTGSTDDTVKLLEERNVHVKTETINPWRFDVARNKSLDLVPIDADICVCTDLDEILNKGWRKELESSWNNSNRLRYIYNWKLIEDKPIITFMYEKIHDRKNYKWIYPVHEILYTTLKEEKVVTNKNIVLNHYPDSNKSRASYLELLELSIKEYPNSDRNMHYLGREYMFHKRYNEAIDILIKHLNMETSKWDQERSASCRFIARCYKELNRIDEARLYLEKAIKECPNKKEGYVELAMLEHSCSNYLESIFNCIKALSITDDDLTYINEPFCKDGTIDDLLSLNYYYLGFKEEAIHHINKALKYNSNDTRLINNKEIFEK